MLYIKHLFKAVVLVAVFITTPALASPEIEHWKTGKGARVYYVHAPELPMVDIRVVFDAGSARDGDMAGLATLTNSLLDEGIPGKDVNAIAETFESVGADYGAESLKDMAVTSIRSLTDPVALQPTLQTYAEVIARPTFPEKSFERNRKAMLVGLQQEQQSPESLAEKAFYRAVYADHPYASPENGTEASLKKMTRKDVVNFHKQYYVARNAVVAIVGAVDKKQAKQIAEQLTKGLEKGKAAEQLPEVPKTLTAPLTRHIEHPSTQTHIRIGQPGSKRGDKDYFALYVGNHILGGSGLVSRLSNEIREKRGLSYSVYSYFFPMREHGVFTMGLQTKNESADEARQILIEQLRKFRDEGPSKEELKQAKQNITGGFALRVDSNKKITGYVAMIGFYGLPLDYLEDFTDNVEDVSIKDIRKAFSKRIDPDKLAIVTVGGGKAKE